MIFNDLKLKNKKKQKNKSKEANKIKKQNRRNSPLNDKMDFLNDDWLLDVVNDLKLGESITVKNKGIGILKVHI